MKELLDMKLGYKKYVAEVIDPDLTKTIIDTTDLMPRQKWGASSNNSPAEALLSAYLAAMETLKEEV